MQRGIDKETKEEYSFWNTSQINTNYNTGIMWQGYYKNRISCLDPGLYSILLSLSKD